MLEVQGLIKNYPDFEVNVDFHIEKGEFFSLLGPSGCGKTTTLRLISGLENSDNGSIYLNGRDITNVPPQKRQFGLVFQDYALFPHLNVEQNILYGIRKASADVKRERLEELLELFQLQKLKARSVRYLSGGEQQRVALARALAPKPELLLLDEPFAALDPTLRQSLREELKELQSKLDLTIIFVTHNQEEALSLSHQVALMDKGKIIQIAKPFNMYTRPASPYVARFFGNVNILELQVVDNKIKWGNIEILTAQALEDGTYLFPIRPEYLKEGKGISGKILSNNFLGFGVEYVVLTPYGKLRYLETAPVIIRENGMEVELALNIENVFPIQRKLQESRDI